MFQSWVIFIFLEINLLQNVGNSLNIAAQINFGVFHVFSLLTVMLWQVYWLSYNSVKNHIYERHLHPGVCSYWASLWRKLFLSSCSLSLPWLQTEILHELKEFKTWVGKKEQLLSETCRWLNLLQCSCSEWERAVSPMVINTNIQKQSEKWQNSSACLHWRCKYPCMNVCNVALEQMHQALLTATFPKRFPFYKY